MPANHGSARCSRAGATAGGRTEMRGPPCGAARGWLAFQVLDSSALISACRLEQDNGTSFRSASLAVTVKGRGLRASAGQRARLFAYAPARHSCPIAGRPPCHHDRNGGGI